VMPVLLRLKAFRLAERTDLTRLLLGIRRGAIVLIVLLGYLYFRLAGEAYALVSIGLISFAAVAQFAPAVFGGIFWKNATRSGALAGLLAGFAVWAYTLLIPALARSDWLPASLLSEGPFGIALLKPLALFGLKGLDQITHAMIWSMVANVGASVSELHHVLARFLGAAAAHQALSEYARARGRRWPEEGLDPDADLVHYVEVQLAGAIGASSARVMVASAVKEEALTLDEVRQILDEASHVVVHSHQLEQKSRELEAATAELRNANARLQELDRMKDDFISTITHELRTPLTSIRAFSEILLSQPNADPAQRLKFVTIIAKETERLSRLINQVLDLAKIDSGRAEWHVSRLDVEEIVADALAGMGQLFKDKGIVVETHVESRLPRVKADVDRLIQVLLNLLSNAVKFCEAGKGRIDVTLSRAGAAVRVDIRDNGPGISPEDQAVIFEKFRQAGDALTNKPAGTGLGLHISRQIIEHFGGRLWVESRRGEGACFSFTLPVEARAEDEVRVAG